MRLVVVSNRLPFTISDKGDGKEFIPSSGGLITSITSYIDSVKSPEYLWIGWAGTDAAKSEQVKLKKKALKLGALPIFLPQDLADNFYNGFCNKIIWPLFHYFTSFGIYDEKYWQAYKSVNKKFCDEVLKVIKPSDTIWIHDYHLMLLPKLLREKMPGAKIGFFLHIPFPSYEVFRLLPDLWRREILEGMLGADLVGFHISEYTRHFLGNVLRVLGYEHSLGKIHFNGKLVLARNFPLGIDFRKFFNASKEKQVVQEKAELNKTLKKNKVILSIDRLDYTKGTVNRLNGFEDFLSRFPNWHKKVVMILVMIPSRIEVNQYELMKRQTEELISKINGLYGSIGWTPILYQFSTVSFERLIALYNRADIALITPLRDGMNLISKEYLAAKAHNAGVLILSEMAGASKELTEAIIINPDSKEEISAAISRALIMPKREQLKRLKRMQEIVEKNDVFSWTESFLGYLDGIKNEQDQLAGKVFDPATKKHLIADFTKAAKRLIFLDYDGTLVPFKSKYWLVKPSKQLMRILKKLSSDKKNEVVIISGRDRNTLEKFFGKLPINLVAEHGLLIKERWSGWKVMSNPSIDWKKEALYLFSSYVDQLPDSSIEEKEFSVAWHYRRSDPVQAAIKSRELMDDLVYFTTNKNLQIVHGNKVIEIKSVYTNKGVVANRWFNRQDFDFILAIGDDKTDEDLFSVLPGYTYSVNVGPHNSSARFNIQNPKKVIQLLSDLAKRSRE